MSKKRTEKSRYPSKYSPGDWVTSAQYIIELVCEKKAESEQTRLPVKFWNLPKWQNYFKIQLRKCHSLLKKYDEKAIIRALNSQEGKRIYSLHAPWLEGIIKYEQILLNQENEQKPESVKIWEKVTDGKPRPYQPQDNLRNKLDE